MTDSQFNYSSLTLDELRTLAASPQVGAIEAMPRAFRHLADHVGDVAEMLTRARADLPNWWKGPAAEQAAATLGRAAAEAWEFQGNALSAATAVSRCATIVAEQQHQMMNVPEVSEPGVTAIVTRPATPMDTLEAARKDAAYQAAHEQAVQVVNGMAAQYVETRDYLANISTLSGESFQVKGTKSPETLHLDSTAGHSASIPQFGASTTPSSNSSGSVEESLRNESSGQAGRALGSDRRVGTSGPRTREESGSLLAADTNRDRGPVQVTDGVHLTAPENYGAQLLESPSSESSGKKQVGTARLEASKDQKNIRPFTELGINENLTKPLTIDDPSNTPKENPPHAETYETRAAGQNAHAPMAVEHLPLSGSLPPVAPYGFLTKTSKTENSATVKRGTTENAIQHNRHTPDDHSRKFQRHLPESASQAEQVNPVYISRKEVSPPSNTSKPDSGDGTSGNSSMIPPFLGAGSVRSGRESRNPRPAYLKERKSVWVTETVAAPPDGIITPEFFERR